MVVIKYTQKSMCQNGSSMDRIWENSDAYFRLRLRGNLTITDYAKVCLGGLVFDEL